MDHYTYIACPQGKSAGGSVKAKEQGPGQKVHVLKSNEQRGKKNTVPSQKIFLYCVSRND